MTDAAKLTPYQWRLFLFLSVATFFEGYDMIALSQILPEFRDELGADAGEGGLVVAFINAGTIVAYLLVRQADRWGRRRVLTITIAGYTIATLLSGLAPSSTFLSSINSIVPGVWIFAFFQFVGRIFLIAEWAISMMFAAEEFPAQKRGLMIGLIQAFSALGSVLCAGAVPYIVAHTPWGWRTVYFLGTIPLVLLAVGRRSLKESSRFESLGAKAKQSHSLFRIFSTPSRKRVIQLALIWGFTYLCTQTSVTFWKEYAVAPAPASGPHFTPDEVGQIVMFAAVGAMPLVFLAGKLLDWLGRRMGAVIIFTIASASCVAAYTLTENKILITIAVCGAIFGGSSVLPVLNAYTTELFPTELRGDAFAWSNNLLGRLGYVAAPAMVGFAAQTYGWGLPIALTAVGPVIALALILWLLPETRGKELEETALMH
jgi:putative MFS transporter